MSWTIRSGDPPAMVAGGIAACQTITLTLSQQTPTSRRRHVSQDRSIETDFVTRPPPNSSAEATRHPSDPR